MAAEPNELPWAVLRLLDDGERGGQAVEIIVDGQPVALLNACRVGYEMNVSGRGVLLVGVKVNDPVEILAGTP